MGVLMAAGEGDVERDKILIVDDDLRMLDAYRRHLKRAFEVDAAKSGEHGITMVSQRGPYAVIISDFRMPGMDGIEFLTRVREAAPDSVRMMLTGYADLEIVMEAVNEGYIFRFLTKPCKPDVLRGALEAGVRQYQLLEKERELAESRRVQAVLEQTEARLKAVVVERTRELVIANKKLQAEVEEKRRAEKALRDSREILQLAMDNIPQCIFWKDANSTYLGCNKSFATLAGVGEPGNIVGKADADLPWPDAELLNRYGEFAMETNTPGFEVIEEVRAEEKRTVLWDTGSFPYHDEEGTVIGVLGMMKDISEEIASEEAMIRRERNESIAKLARAFYNELREPLNIMDLSRDKLSKAQKHTPMYYDVKKIIDQVDVIQQIALKLDKIAGTVRSG